MESHALPNLCQEDVSKSFYFDPGKNSALSSRCKVTLFLLIVACPK